MLVRRAVISARPRPPPAGTPPSLLLRVPVLKTTQHVAVHRGRRRRTRLLLLLLLLLLLALLLLLLLLHLLLLLPLQISSSA